MAVTSTGPAFGVSTTAQTGSTSILVPSDATAVVVGMGGYPFGGSDGYFGVNAVLTLGGNTLLVGHNDDTTGNFMSAIKYYVSASFPTSTQVFSWNFGSNIANDISDGTVIAFAFYNGVDTASPLKASGGQQVASGTASTGSMTAATGDLAIAYSARFNSITSSITWTNATPIVSGQFGTEEFGLAQAFPTTSINILADDGSGADSGISGIVLKASSATTTNALTASGIATGAPSVGSPTIAQTQILTASNVATGAPAVGSPTITAIVAMTAGSVATGTPAVGSPTISQTQKLTATGVATGIPEVGAPTVAQTHALTASSVATGAPAISTPALNAGTSNLTATGIATGAPVLGAPSLSEVLPLPSAVIRGAPVWWRGWPYDEDEEEEKPEVVNEIIEVPETPHETPTENVVIARSIKIQRANPQYQFVESRVMQSLRPELEKMHAEHVQAREIKRKFDEVVRKRVKRMRDDEEILLLS